MATLAGPTAGAAGSCLSDGRSWHKCEVPTGFGNVCCWGQTGPKADITKSTRLTLSGQGEP
jgi:hypothetical protein